MSLLNQWNIEPAEQEPGGWCRLASSGYSERWQYAGVYGYMLTVSFLQTAGKARGFIKSRKKKMTIAVRRSKNVSGGSARVRDQDMERVRQFFSIPVDFQEVDTRDWSRKLENES